MRAELRRARHGYLLALHLLLLCAAGRTPSAYGLLSMRGWPIAPSRPFSGWIVRWGVVVDNSSPNQTACEP